MASVLSVLRMSEMGDYPPLEEPDEEGSGDGIYSITVESYNGTFIKCFTIKVDRSPNSTFEAPAGYKKMSSAESLSMGGVHIVEHFIPAMLLDVDIQILLLPDSINPTSGAASGIEFKALTHTQRTVLYQKIDDVKATFEKLMEVAGKPVSNVDYSMKSTKCLSQLSFGFDNVGPLEIDGLLRKRITPAVFMQIVYAGFGLVLVQNSDDLEKWTLTDTMEMISDSTPTSVSLEHIASLRTSYDYKKMAKSTHIALGATGNVVESIVNGNDTPATVAQLSYRDSGRNRPLSSSRLSIATGANVEMSAPAMPLLRFATYKDVTVSGDEATQNLDGDCFGGGVIKAKVSKTKKMDGGFKMRIPSATKEVTDISALGVKVKGALATFLHGMMNFKNKLESTQLSITFDGAVVPAFSSFMIEGAGALQKVVISSSEAKREVETANVGATGFVMSSTIIRSSGRVISMVSYANMADAYPLVFAPKS